jgi:Rrf2 family iron-sulfur cluster assembly transcriptional regulator
MKLSTRVDYAVRAVYELARRMPGSVMPTSDIAAAQHISAPRLAKVVHDLARADLVRTKRGHQGGVMLARPAAEITVRDVYEAVEGPILLCRCRQRVEPCVDEGCDTHDFWHGVETLLTEELQSTTFAALTDARRRAPLSRAAAGRRRGGDHSHDSKQGAG